MMRRAMVAAVGGLWAGCGWGQTHAVKKPETVVRAVSVFEWTGDEKKPTASRVVPVSIFINGQIEDAGLYMARPVPFALDRGTIFEVQRGGAPQGTVELSYDRHYTSSGDSRVPHFDDGWLGYGALKLAANEPVMTKKSGPISQVVVSGGKGPHFSNGDSGNATDKDSKDKAQPVDRSGAAGGGTTVSAQNDPDQADSNRPTMRRRTGSGSGSGSGSGDTTTASSGKSGSSSTDDDDDVERPTLKRRTPQEQKAAEKKKQTASVSSGVDLNDDPDRPNLHRGKPGLSMDEQEIPPLKGLPKDMQQMVAVSDAKDRPEHAFERIWESDEERADVTLKMEALAREKLAGYDVGAVAVATAAPGAAAPAAAATAKAGQGGPQSAAARARAKKAAAAAAASAKAAPVVALTDEALKGYTLSYGGAATYVYTASSAGVGNATRYVTVVAQREPLGSLKVAMANVTDSTHLDRMPWMRLVDVVDAEASNRASLLFELRGETSRQFALYRVIGAAAQQTFATAVVE